MDRRNFLKTTGTLIAGATLAPGTFANNPPQTHASHPRADGSTHESQLAL